MKIGILTHYDVNNQGAQLQLYALYLFLKEHGHDPVVLTYRKNYDLKPDQERRNQITFRSIPYVVRTFLIKKGLGLTWHNMRKYLINKKFRSQFFNYASYCLEPTDVVLVGADEVFSLEFGVNMMMFGHGVNTKALIAYAPSMGQTDMKQIEHFHFKALMASGLKCFYALSARDEHTRDAIRQLTQREVDLVCDPVLLYSFDLKNVPLPGGLPKRDYMVVYSYDSRFIDEEQITAIRAYAEKHHLAVVSPGTYHRWCDYNVVCNCLSWLKCIEQAKAIVTDTFHGTIASVITCCPMALCYSPRSNANKMMDLIKRLGLQKRLLEGMTAEHLEYLFSSEINWNEVGRLVEDFREESITYLLNGLSGDYEKARSNES